MPAANFPDPSCARATGPAQDAGQRVVDVVRHAKRKLTERGHLVGMRCLFTLRFVRGVRRCNLVQTLAQAFTRSDCWELASN